MSAFICDRVHIDVLADLACRGVRAREWALLTDGRMRPVSPGVPYREAA